MCVSLETESTKERVLEVVAVIQVREVVAGDSHSVFSVETVNKATGAESVETDVVVVFEKVSKRGGRKQHRADYRLNSRAVQRRNAGEGFTKDKVSIEVELVGRMAGERSEAGEQGAEGRDHEQLR